MAQSRLSSLLGMEIRLLGKDRAAVWVMVVFAVLVAWASWQGGGRADARRQADVAALHDAQVRAQRVVADGVDVETAGREALRPSAVLGPRPLAGIITRDAGPTRVELTTAPVIEAQARDALDADSQAAGPLDLIFLLVQLLPLVVIALSYELLAGDRERGMLSLLLSYPMRLRDLLWAKVLARGLVLAGLLALGLIVAIARGAIALDQAGAWGDLAWLVVLVMSWAGFWFAAAIAVNAWGRSSSGNALTLVTLWLVLVVVGPGLLRVAVEGAYPPPSRVALATQARDAAATAAEALEAIEGDHRAPGKAESGKAGALGDGGKAAIERELAARLAPIRSGFELALSNQQAAIDRWRPASPAITTSEALVALAGEDLSRRRAWLDDVSAWHAALRAHFEVAHAQTAAAPSPSAGKLAAVLATLPPMPELTPRAASAEGLQARLAIDALVIGLWALVALGIGIAGLRRELGRLT